MNFTAPLPSSVGTIRIRPGSFTTAQDLRDIVDGWTSTTNTGRNLIATLDNGTSITYKPSFQMTTPVQQMDWKPENFLMPIPTGAIVDTVDVPCK